jgi:hypothetical protein
MSLKTNQNDQVNEDEMGRACSTRNAYKLLVGKSEGKRPRHKRVDNIILNLKRYNGIGCTDLALDRGQWRAPVNMVTHL